jgi:hypothetical protein
MQHVHYKTQIVSMCLTPYSLDSLVQNYNRAGRDLIPDADITIAACMYKELWPKLDHTRRYCVNPLIFAAELLEYANVGQYPQVRRFDGQKGQHYKDTIALILSKVSASV